MSNAPYNPTRRQEEQRGKYLAMIRETRQKFMSDFPEGCRVEFRRGPSTWDNPTLRVGKATILKITVLREGMVTIVRYRLDISPNNSKRGFSECPIQVFLKDNPVRIEDPP
jgi:hypothetical protein